MFTVGLTGGIASGKSTVVNIFSNLGAGTVNADQLAKQAVVPGTTGHKKLVAEFGKAILQPNGEIDRTQLRKQIFESDEDRVKLEKILHPEILLQIEKTLADIKQKYAVVEIPLLVEKGLQSNFDRVLVVDCALDTQLKRLMRRDAEDEASARNIISTQISREQRLAAADDVISNDSTIENLDSQVAALHEKYLDLTNELD